MIFSCEQYYFSAIHDSSVTKNKKIFVMHLYELFSNLKIDRRRRGKGEKKKERGKGREGKREREGRKGEKEREERKRREKR
jgi:hypothetical protein